MASRVSIHAYSDHSRDQIELHHNYGADKLNTRAFQGSYDILELERREAAIAAAFAVGRLPRPVLLCGPYYFRPGQRRLFRWLPVSDHIAPDDDASRSK